MNLLISKLKKLRGFTLVEMMVVTAIIVTLSMVMVIHFKAGKDKDDLRNAAYLVASVLHQAQAEALAGKTTTDPDGNLKTPNGYGVAFIPNYQIMVLFAELSSDMGGMYDGYLDPGECDYQNGTCYHGEIYNFAELYPKVSLDSKPCYFDVIGINVTNDWFCDQGDMHFIYTIPFGNRRVYGQPENVGAFCVILKQENLGNQGIVISSDAASGQIKMSDIKTISGDCYENI